MSGPAVPTWAGVRERLRPSRWSLSTKLVAVVVGLFLVVTVATASLTVVLLRDSLMDQLDQDVSSAAMRAGGVNRGPAPGDGGPARPLPGGRGESLTLVISDSGTTSRVEHDQTVGTLTAAQVTQLQDAGLGPNPRTVDVRGLGDYRLVALARPDGDVLITGLPTSGVTYAVGQYATLVTGSTAVGLVIVGAAGLWLVRRNLAALQRVSHTATQVSRLKLDEGDVALAQRVPAADTDERTEVGQVGLALNSLLDNVEGALQARHESEQRVRQFVADASHELRTPLASIRGYAELSRRERDPVPPSVTHALGRVESEALRMQDLVEDLLLLARLDAGRPLERDPVDLTRVVVDAVGDAHAASPDHRWQLDLPEEPVEVVGDEARLHQVLVNLLANARTHTPEGTCVTTALRRDGDEVRLSVADDGPGIPESLRPNVFQRFTRGDDSRNRAAGSTGLGLSIVDAVATSHGGRVELSSASGETRFTVVLPVG